MKKIAPLVPPQKQEYSYTIAVDGGRLKVRGPAAPRPDLKRAIVENRNALAARVLLSALPAWLAMKRDLYASGHETKVRRIEPEKGGTKRCLVRVSVENMSRP